MNEISGQVMTEDSVQGATPRELERAMSIAHEAHGGQVRKGSHVPYVTHCEAVAKRVAELEQEAGFEIEDPDLQIVAWLHDVLEDNPDWTPERLLGNGISPRNVMRVVALTKIKGESYYDLIMRAMEDDVTAYVKMADLHHNLSDLEPGNKRDKYLLALELLRVTWIGSWVFENVNYDDADIKKEG